MSTKQNKAAEKKALAQQSKHTFRKKYGIDSMLWEIRHSNVKLVTFNLYFN